MDIFVYLILAMGIIPIVGITLYVLSDLYRINNPKLTTFVIHYNNGVKRYVKAERYLWMHSIFFYVGEKTIARFPGHNVHAIYAKDSYMEEDEV